MPQGQAVPESIQWIVVRLSTAMTIDEICGYTDISNQKVRDIIAHFKTTGDINIQKCKRSTPHISLQDEDIQVLFTLC
jgi:transcription initiation factor IIE alpha subunit